MSAQLVIPDTNALSELRKRDCHPNVARFVASVERFAIAATTITEITFGVELLRQRGGAAAHQRAAVYAVWLDELIKRGPVLPLDADASRLFGRLLTVPELRNMAITAPGSSRPRYPGDLAVAAVAVVNSASVATRNISDFWRIARHCPELVVHNPFDPPV